jgi:hypothetical protein
MQTPQDRSSRVGCCQHGCSLEGSSDLIPLICGSVSGLFVAGLLMASGLARISLGVPQLLGVHEAPEPVAARASLR